MLYSMFGHYVLCDWYLSGTLKRDWKPVEWIVGEALIALLGTEIGMSEGAAQ